MVLELLFVAVLPAILITAGAWDLTTFTIPNIFPAVLVLLFVVFAAAMLFAPLPIAFAQIELQLAGGGIGLAVGVVFFALGLIGGGDAKFFAAAALWLGWHSLLEYAVLASLYGGVLTIGILILRQVPVPNGLVAHDWFMRLTDRRSGIPYGVALSAAALSVLPNSDLFRLAAAQ